MSSQSFSNDNSSDDDQSFEEDILLSIDIQLSEDETGTLKIRENDDIEEKVNEFCIKYNMSEQLKKILNAQVMEHLESQINQLEEEEDANTIKEPNGNESQAYSKEEEKEEAPKKTPAISSKYQSFQSFKDIRPNGKEDTLEQNSKISEASVKTQPQVHSPPHPHEKNKGEQLYKQHLEQLPKKEMQMKRLRDEIKDNAGKEAYFKPSISENSKQLAQKYYSQNTSRYIKDQGSTIEDRLLLLDKQKKEKVQKEIEKKEAKEKQMCSFKPLVEEKSQVFGEIKRRIRKEELPNKLKGINPEYLVDKDLKEKMAYYHDRSYSNTQISNESNQSKRQRDLSPINRRDNSADIIQRRSHDVFNRTTKIFHRKVPIPQFNPAKKLHDYLYIESKLMEEKKIKETNKQLKTDCTFTPYIPQTVRKLINRKETEDQFIKRLAKTKQQREKVEIKKDPFKLFDLSTGKKYFRPTVSRGPKKETQRDVSINLDSFYDNKLLEQKRKEHEIELCNMLEKKKLFLERSVEIILKMKFEKYKEIFSMLDSDKDGLISSKHIRLSVLDQSLLEAMTPLLEDMQKNNLQMNFKSFCLKVDKLLTVKIFDENEYYLQVSSHDTTLDKGVNQSNGDI